MTFEEFTDAVVRGMPDYLTQYEIEQIRLEQVTKNNGVVYTAMLICVKGEELSPNLYLEYYYSVYRQGRGMEEIFGILRDDFIGARQRIDTRTFLRADAENIRERIFLKLVHYKRNEKILAECPYIPFHDLAVTFRYLVQEGKEGIASAIVKTADMEQWGLTTGDLYGLAKRNMERLFPVMLKNMAELMNEELSVSDFSVGDLGLYVLTNVQRVNGASYMLCREVLASFAKEHDCNFYILPSSIHEVLLLPEHLVPDVGYLKETVRDVNACAVSATEYLSDHVYYYDRTDGSIRICA